MKTVPRLVLALSSIALAGCTCSPAAAPKVPDATVQPFLPAFIESLQEPPADPLCQPPQTVEQLIAPFDRLDNCP